MSNISETDDMRSFASKAMVRMIKPKRHSTRARIWYTVTNKVQLFVNGRKVSSVTRWDDFRRVSGPLSKDDVLSLKVEKGSSAPGVIADLIMYRNNKRFVTSAAATSAWKGIREFPDPEHNWMKSSYDACHWPKMKEVDRNDLEPGSSPDFPYENGAKFVWSSTTDDKSENAGFFLRFKVGEHCGHGSASDTKRGSKGRPFCRCKKVEGPAGKCYDMVKRFSSKGRLCDLRPCQPSYVCQPNGFTRGTYLCVRRLAKLKVVSLGHGFCKKVRIKQYHFYSPYDS